jgi:ubiquinone/menaquinone biosynthesis C-methylase UbiE
VTSEPSLTHRLRDRYFRPEDHPFRLYERRIEDLLTPESVLVDGGCGRTAPVLKGYVGKAARLIGVDPIEFDREACGPDIELVQAGLDATGLPDGEADLVVSRALMEHVQDPAATYREVFRILKPGGRFMYLAPNLGDYGSLAAWMIPNRMHPWIVEKTEGRSPQDTFPTYFRANSRRAVNRLAEQSGFGVERFEYLGQYPAYLMFNPVAFLVGTAYEKVISSVSALGFLRGWIMVQLRKPS